jgi:hypothetical protein
MALKRDPNREQVILLREDHNIKEAGLRYRERSYQAIDERQLFFVGVWRKREERMVTSFLRRKPGHHLQGVSLSQADPLHDTILFR